MTEQDILLVASLAFLAVAITLADLLYSWRRHRRRLALARRPPLPGSAETVDEVAARREAIRRRIAAIQGAGGEPQDAL